jgi:hypothetical protein
LATDRRREAARATLRAWNEYVDGDGDLDPMVAALTQLADAFGLPYDGGSDG